MTLVDNLREAYGNGCKKGRLETALQGDTSALKALHLDHQDHYSNRYISEKLIEMRRQIKEVTQPKSHEPLQRIAFYLGYQANKY